MTVPSGAPVVSLSPSERSEDANPSSDTCSQVHPGQDIWHGPYAHNLLSLEDRLLVALSKRGDMSIGGFIDTAVHRYDGAWPVVSDFEDKDLVLACEEYAAWLDVD